MEHLHEDVGVGCRQRVSEEVAGDELEAVGSRMRGVGDDVRQLEEDAGGLGDSFEDR